MDILITIPQKIRWAEYELELNAVKNGKDIDGVLNYRLANPPGNSFPGDRCFVVHKGYVRGWQEIVGVKHYPDGFICDVTGTYWRPGYYIQRSGPFHYIKPLKYRGFQGWRYFDYESYKRIAEKRDGVRV